MSAKKVIFIVEDDKDFLFIYNVILKDQYELYLFEQADDHFFKKLSSVKPDLVLLDWQIPTDNADVVIDTLNKNYANTKILVISCLADIDRRISQGAADGVVQKPVHMHVMQQLIKDLVETDSTDGQQTLTA